MPELERITSALYRFGPYWLAYWPAEEGWMLEEDESGASKEVAGPFTDPEEVYGWWRDLEPAPDSDNTCL